MTKIEDISVIVGPAGISAPVQYTMIPVDLNAGAGGPYIFLCYKVGDNNPITGLTVTTGLPPQAPDLYTLINVDLNQGVGGAYIYLSYTRDTSLAPITGLQVIAGGSPNVQVPQQYKKIDVDLNAGAGGAYIYLCYTRQAQ